MVTLAMTVLKHFRKTFRKAHFSIVFVSVLSLLLTPFLGVFPNKAHATDNKTYYVDCDPNGGGNDADSGTTEALAWKTIGKVNNTSTGIGDSTDLHGGDKLFLKRGTTCSGTTLNVPWSGSSASSVVTIGAYGSGDYPTIEITTSGTTHAVVITGSYVTIENIHAKLSSTSAVDVTHAEGTPNYCDSAPNTRNGDNKGFFFKEGSTYNTLQYSKTTGGWAGVKINDTSTNNKILHNIFTDNNMMNPIDVQTGVDHGDSGAFGVLIWGDNNEIAYNYFSGHSACSFDFGYDGSDVEIYGGDDNYIHHNTSKNSNGFSEHGAVSSDQSKNNTYTYNLMDSNLQGGHFLTVRGYDDSTYGDSENTTVYNNTIYLTGGTVVTYDKSQGFSCTNGCTGDILTFKNNIVWVGTDNDAGSVTGSFDQGYNLYWDTDGGTVNKGFTPDGTSPDDNPDFVSATDFHLQTSSPAIDTGTTEAVSAGYNKDLDGQLLSLTGPDKGAYSSGSGWSFNPVADSYVSSATPTSNYGTNVNLKSDGSPEDIAYLRFDLTPLAGRTITSAKLRMNVTSISNDTFYVKGVSDTTWIEYNGQSTDIDYNNKPARTTLSPEISFAPSSTGWKEVDVTSYMDDFAGSLVSMAIDTLTTNTDGFAFDSKENTSNNKVELLVKWAKSINPVADSYVSSATPTSNYGASVDVRADGTPQDTAYLRFDLSSLAGETFNNAKLHMNVTNISTGTFYVKGVSDTTWIEYNGQSTDIDYNNRPAVTTLSPEISFAPSSTGWKEVDVTSYMDDFAGALESMAIDTTNSDAFEFDSREGTNKVKLVVTQ